MKIKTYTLFTRCFALGLLLTISIKGIAQCSNWSISTQLVTASTCAGNGSFTVTISGADVANLTNIQYAIPTAANGFSVPLNNAATFNNIPGGTYQVSAVATCGDSIVGKNTNITVPGGYTQPTISAGLARGSISCGAYGQISMHVANGVAPYTVHITSAPSGYTGPLSFAYTGNNLVIGSLPPGNYGIQAVDACGSGTDISNVYVTSLDLSTLPLIYPSPTNSGCDTLLIPKPSINYNVGGVWAPYQGDTLFKVSVAVSNNNITLTSIFSNMNDSAFVFYLPPGNSLKSFYGKTITYTIKPPCGANIQVTQTVPYPNISGIISQNCNVNFTDAFSFSGAICYPVTYSVYNTATSASYGPFTANGASTTTPAMPIGAYTLSYTTGDGYVGSSTFGTSDITGNPYSVSVTNGATGLNNYILQFDFYTAYALSTSITVELFSGPSGYSFIGTWYGGNYFSVAENQTPSEPGTLLFPPGNYVWKITDNCGSYLLPITVGTPDVYQFTVDIGHQWQTCQGLWVTPAGTATNNGQSMPFNFAILKDGQPIYSPAGTANWPQYALGDSFLVSSPGVYTIVTSSGLYTYPIDTTVNNIYLGILSYPNLYTHTYSFMYSVKPVAVDLNRSQGFLCKNASAGQGEIYVKGEYGTPFSSATAPYIYYLAQQGNGVAGPYLATNTTGIFTGFGGNANDIYDLKVQDSCGAFAIQQLKILDLGTVNLISSSSYVACVADSVQLSASYLPNATYYWTGPNGFTSTLRTPVIYNAGPQTIGVYYVIVSTPECSQTITDSTTLTMAPNPPKPVVSVSCLPLPESITVANPTPGIEYEWHINALEYGYNVTVASDTGNTEYIFIPGIYNAIAVDTTTGCTAYSDSLLFATASNASLNLTVYSPHLQLCTGDTTILVAQSTAIAPGYQWFQNGTPIAGATNVSYVTSIAGTYKVSMLTGPCGADTSASVTVTVVPIPTATISAPVQTICAGDTAFIQANAGPGYSYTWYFNNSTVAGQTSSTLAAMQAGDYFVVVSNGGCIATSASVHITVNPGPVVNLTPSATQTICAGNTIDFSTPFNASYTYAWQKNGNIIPNAITNTYQATTTGTYSVLVSAPACPPVSSVLVFVNVLPAVPAVAISTTTLNICVGQTAFIQSDAGVGYTYTWYFNDNPISGATSTTFSATQTGSYYMVVSNAACADTSNTINISVDTPVVINFPADTTICNSSGEAIFSVPDVLQNILWSTGAITPSITIAQPGIYWVQAQSSCGALTDTIQVNFCAPVIDNINNADTICSGECITVSAQTHNYPQTFGWSFAGGSPSSFLGTGPSLVCYTDTGTYSIKLVVHNAGGADSQTNNITVLPQPVAAFADTIISVPYNTTLTLPACATAMHTQWFHKDSLVCDGCATLLLQPKDYQSTYQCVVSNATCTDTCIYNIAVTDIPTDTWMPSAFSPNGDGKNDYFHMVTDNPNIYLIELSVYNRWGQLIYTTGINDKGWNGTFGGMPVDVGTYFWHLRYKVLGTIEMVYSMKGDVTVLR